MSWETTSGDEAGRPTCTCTGSRRSRGRGVAAQRKWLAASAVVLLAAVAGRPAAAQDTTSAQPQVKANVLRVLITKTFAAKMDSTPAKLTWDDVRKGVVVKYDATPATAKTGKKLSLVFYAAMASGGKVQKEFTSEPFDVFPTATVSQPGKFLPEKPMLPSGVNPKGTFVVGKVTVPASGLLSPDMKGIIEDLSGSEPVLYLLAAPADTAARSQIQAAPLVLTTKG